MGDNINSFYGDSKYIPYVFKQKRLNSICLYCGKDADSREHLPSKVFFNDISDIPFLIVPACETCNHGFSKDEEYLGCLLEYFKKYMFFKDYSIKPSILSTLEKRPSLRTDLDLAFSSLLQNGYVDFNADRVKHVLLKLAQGHILKDFNEIYLRHQPEHFAYKFISEMSENELQCFNSVETTEIVPELGFRNAYVLEAGEERFILFGWEVYSENEYRVLTTSSNDNRTARIVIGEILFCEVIWNVSQNQIEEVETND